MAKITAKVKMETTMGDMLIGLYGEDVKLTVDNFLSYVEEGFYDGLIFHRVIPGFVIQGGGMEPGMKQKETKAPIKLEVDNDFKHTKGILSMARTNVRDSGTSQFFVCLDEVPSLNTQYAVFGELIEGLDVLDEIGATATTTSGYHSDVPQNDIIITKATIVE